MCTYLNKYRNKKIKKLKNWEIPFGRISATEMLCKSLERTDEPDVIEMAQTIRNFLLSHIRKDLRW